MSYPPHLMDALARVYAKVALDRLIKDETLMQPEVQCDTHPAAHVPPVATAEKHGNVDGPMDGESSDNRSQPLSEPSG